MIDPRNPDFSRTPDKILAEGKFVYRPRKAVESPALSIVTPYFNTDESFEATARTVLGQSLQNLEWIIVDDGTTDPGALSRLDAVKADPRVRIIRHGQNKGLPAARNTGFRAARSEFVFQIDSDDLVEPTACEKMCWFLATTPNAAFIKGYNVGFGSAEYLWTNGFDRGAEFLKENFVTSIAIIRKSVFEMVGGYDEELRRGLEDWEFWLRCAAHGYWGGMIPEYCDWYRRRSSHQDRWKEWDKNLYEQIVVTPILQKFPHLQDSFPTFSRAPIRPNTVPATEAPFENLLEKKTKRVLFVIPWIEVGGADQFNINMAHGLGERGWEVSIITTLPNDDPWAPEMAKATTDIFMLDHFLTIDEYARFADYLITSRDIDVVVVSNSKIGYSWLPWLRARHRRVAFVDYNHCEEIHWENGGHPLSGTLYQPCVDLNLVASDHLKRWMTERGADPARIQTCYIGVDTKKFSPVSSLRRETRDQLGAGSETPVILTVARLAPQKQPEILIRSLLRLRELRNDFQACIVGDGPLFKTVSEMIAEYRAESYIKLLGAISNDRVSQLFAAADIFFLPSGWEGIALTLYEAAACGVAVVASDIGGQRELIDDSCGRLVPLLPTADLPERFAMALSELLSSPGLAQRMGAIGRQRMIDRFDLSMWRDRFESLLEEARIRRQESPRTPDERLGFLFLQRAIEHFRAVGLS